MKIPTCCPRLPSINIPPACKTVAAVAATGIACAVIATLAKDLYLWGVDYSDCIDRCVTLFPDGNRAFDLCVEACKHRILSAPV